MQIFLEYLNLQNTISLCMVRTMTYFYFNQNGFLRINLTRLKSAHFLTGRISFCYDSAENKLSLQYLPTVDKLLTLETDEKVSINGFYASEMENLIKHDKALTTDR